MLMASSAFPFFQAWNLLQFKELNSRFSEIAKSLYLIASSDFTTAYVKVL
jgi:hypothetical protein